MPDASRSKSIVLDLYSYLTMMAMRRAAAGCFTFSSIRTSCSSNSRRTNTPLLVLLVLLAVVTVTYVYNFLNDDSTAGSATPKQLQELEKGEISIVSNRNSSSVSTRGDTVDNSNDDDEKKTKKKRLDSFDLSFTLFSKNADTDTDTGTEARHHHHHHASNTQQQQQGDDEPSVSSKRPLCTRRENIDHGSWEYVELIKPPYVTPTIHLRCYTAETYTQSPYRTWEWVVRQQEQRKSESISISNHTNDEHRRSITRGNNNNNNMKQSGTRCDFTKWRSSQFCKLLRGDTVLIVGDSLSWEHYSSLVQLLGRHTHQGYQWQSKFLLQTIAQAVCKNGRTRIAYRRDDRLSNLSSILNLDDNEDDGNGSDNDNIFPTVLILNQGAHYMNDTMLIQNLHHNLIAVDQWLDKCQERQVQCHFYWRTSVPGHPNCFLLNSNSTSSAYNNPINDKEWIENQLIGNMSNYDEQTLKYHWYDYQHQNMLVEQELTNKFGGDKVERMILDAYHLNVLRPDEHRVHQRDCLHSCYPGKMDVYNRLLLHQIRRSRSGSLQKAATAAAMTNKEDSSSGGDGGGSRRPHFVDTKYDPEATEQARQQQQQQQRH